MPARIFLCLIALGWLTGAAAAPEIGPLRLSHPAAQQELVAVVTGQLGAFRADDWPKAYSYAAKSFQAAVPLENFTILISKNYVVVWKNTKAEFGIASDNGHRAVVPVRIFGDGRSETYNYLLIREDDHWRITGVLPQETHKA